MLIDTHCHVHFRAYDNDRDVVIRRALGEGVRMVSVGTDHDTSEAAIRLAANYDGIWATVGLHPNHLFEYPTDSDEEVASTVERFDPEAYRRLAKQGKVVAIGECG
ncbi:TatD family hydrolase, partial [Candidatus Uhrbacteria bacterium]|nr:TatD family hydrolase [Candidatus Uhrbacteria bacterium]